MPSPGLLLIIRILRGEPFERASLREWKWGVGGLGAAIGMLTCYSPVMFSVMDSLSNTQLLLRVLVALPVLALFLFCFADIMPAIWSLGIGVCGWAAAAAGAVLHGVDVKAPQTLCHIGLALFASFSALGLVKGLLHRKRKG